MVLVIGGIGGVRLCRNGWWDGHVGGGTCQHELPCLSKRFLDDQHNVYGGGGLDGREVAGVGDIGAAPQQLRHPLSWR